MVERATMRELVEVTELHYMSLDRSLKRLIELSRVRRHYTDAEEYVYSLYD